MALYTAGGLDLGYGFVDAATDTGALSDKEFSVGTNSYTIDDVWTGVGSLAGTLNFGLTSDLDAADLAKLVLHVDSTSLAFSAATGPDSAQAYRWGTSGLDWSSTSEVTLRLRDTATTKVTIAADHAAFIATVDDVTFTLTRTEDLSTALDVAVALTQDLTLLASDQLAQTVTFSAGKATAKLKLRNFLFQDHTLFGSGSVPLTATVQTGSGYEPGSPNMVSTQIVVADPALTVWIEETAYTFAEDATDATVAVIFRTATGGTPPHNDIYISISAEEDRRTGEGRRRRLRTSGAVNSSSDQPTSRGTEPNSPPARK